MSLQWSADSLTVVALVTKNNPLLQKGATIYLNATAPFTDKAGIHPSRKGIRMSRYEQLYFARKQNPDAAVASFSWPHDSSLVAVLKRETITPQTDTIILTLSLQSGDSETVVMVEKDDTCGVFVATIPFTYGEYYQKNDGRAVAVYSSVLKNDQQTITGRVNYAVSVSSCSALLIYYAPPQVIGAFYGYSPLNTTAPDTLIITVNVPVVWPPNMRGRSLFTFWDGMNHAYNAVTAAYLDQRMVVVDSTHCVMFIERSRALTPDIDSCQFIPFVKSIHTAQMVYPGRAGLVPLTATAEPEFVLTIGPNPFYLLESAIPARYLSFAPEGQSSGCLLKIASRKKMLSASYSILDPLGNPVRKKIPFTLDGATNNMYSIWNGKTENDKFVGTGIYKVTVVIVDVANQSYGKGAFVGIKEPVLHHHFYIKW
jgi:hypothetical protein